MTSDPALSAASAWDTGATKTWRSELPPLPPVAVALKLDVHSSRASMLIVDVFLEQPGAPGGYKTSFIVEWAGWQTISLRISALESADSPAPHALQDVPLTQVAYPLSQATAVRMEALSCTFEGTILHFGAIAWLDEMPLIPINPHECLLEDFTSARFWDEAEWARTERTTVPAEDGGLKKVWFFAELWYTERPGRLHRLSYSKTCDRDLREFQALTVSASIDRRVTFSLILTIDGRPVAVLDHKRGLGDGEEVRVPIGGSRLQGITIEIEEAPDAAGQSAGQGIAAMVRWFLLERRTSQPVQANEVRGMPAVAPPAQVESFEARGLPVGVLFGRDDVPELRRKVRSGLPGRFYAEIVAEAESHLGYQPEQYVGRYVPIDYGNSQGAGRMSAPMEQMAHYASCMVYSGLVYLLDEALEHGLMARRALLSTIRCDEWASGFVSRIPVGLPGYRAPFVTASTACAVALCYDFVHPLLSPDERREVEDALMTKAIPWLDLYLRLYGEGYLLESNQGPVFSRGLIYAALVARRSHPEAQALLDRWTAWFHRMLTVCYRPDGSTNEGPSYWEYTTHEVVAALLAISRHEGKPIRDLTPANLVNSMDYMLHMRSMSSQRLSFLNIGDCAVDEAKYMGPMLLFFARFFDNHEALWLWKTFCADQQHPPGSPFFGIRLGPYVVDGLLTLLWCLEGGDAPPQLPPARRFPECDRFFLRTGAQYGDMLLFFEGGPMIPGHAHADKGQFLLEAFGERLAADPGMVQYADPAAEMLQGSACHNVVTIGGRDQSFKNLERAVVTEAFEDTDSYSYIRADVSNAYRELSLFKRQLLFVRPYYVLVLDEVESLEPGLEWNFHTAGELSVNGDFLHVDAPKAGMLVCLASPQPLNAATGAYREGQRVITHNLALAADVQARSLRLAALMAPYPKTGAPPPRVERSLTPDGAQFTVQGEWGADVIACRFRPATGEPLTADRIRIVRRSSESGAEDVCIVSIPGSDRRESL